LGILIITSKLAYYFAFNCDQPEGGFAMNDPKHPELHVNEEPSNDFLDTAIGFGAFFGVLLLMGVAATVIQLMTR
jgi:hypothetical protein